MFKDCKTQFGNVISLCNRSYLYTNKIFYCTKFVWKGKGMAKTILGGKKRRIKWKNSLSNFQASGGSVIKTAWYCQRDSTHRSVSRTAGPEITQSRASSFRKTQKQLRGGNCLPQVVLEQLGCLR